MHLVANGWMAWFRQTIPSRSMHDFGSCRTGPLNAMVSDVHSPTQTPRGPAGAPDVASVLAVLPRRQRCRSAQQSQRVWADNSDPITLDAPAGGEEAAIAEATAPLVCSW